MLKLLKYELIHEWRSYGIIYLVLSLPALCRQSYLKIRF